MRSVRACAAAPPRPYLWHVHVIHEHQQAFAHGGAVRVFGSFFHVRF